MDPSRQLETVEDEARRLASGFADTAKKVISVLVLVGWSMLWGVVALFGWGVDVPALMWSGLGILGVSWAGLGSVALIRRRRLVRRARWSLIARTRLHKIGLGKEAKALLETYDLAAEEVDRLLATPALSDRKKEYRTDFAAVGDRLFELARREGELRGVVRRLERASSAASASSEVLAATKRELATVREEADRLAGEAHRFSGRLREVRRLTDGTSDRAAPSLGAALDELHGMATALREIEETEKGIRRPMPERSTER